MTNTYELQLTSTNKLDKRKKKENNYRKVLLDLDKIKSWEGQQVNSKEVYQIDKEMFDKRNGRLGGSEVKQIERMLERIFEDFNKVKSQKGNSKDYLFGNLFNEDGTPIDFEETRGKKASELTQIFKALLLLLLEEISIDIQARTLNNWLEFFGFINKQQIADMNEFYKSIYEKDEKDKSKRNKFVLSLLKRNVLPQSCERMFTGSNNIPINNDLTDNEVLNLYKTYNKRTLQALKHRLRSVLENLNKENMIKLYTSMYGVGIYEVYDKEKSKYVEYTRIVELTDKEKQELIRLELELKEKLGLESLLAYDLYTHKEYKEALTMCLKDGLKTDESSRRFEYVYEAFTITKSFTKSNLKDFLDKKENVKIKTYFKKGKDILINEYRHARLDHVVNCIENKKEEYENKILDESLKKRNNKARIGKSYEEIRKVYNNSVYAELSKTLSSNLLIYYHYDMLSKYEVPEMNLPVYVSKIDLIDLPF